MRRWLAVPVLALAAGCAAGPAGGDRPRAKLQALDPDPGLAHVHGMGVNPADGDLYAATHMGVFRVAGPEKATRIANRYQDTMGFTIVGPDHFMASGHPDLREDLPKLLGLIESRDAARTWSKESLLGKADFHALRYAHGTVYGFDSTGAAFMVSGDGRSWETRSKTTLRDFVVSPADAGVVLATTPDGLKRSGDGGRTWSAADAPAQPVLLDWQDPGRLWLLDYSGRVHVSADGGTTWEARGAVAERPGAFLAAAHRLYAAVSDGIFASDDGGRTWRLFFGPDAAH